MTDFQELELQIRSRRRELDQRVGQEQSLRKIADATEKELVDLEEEVKLYELVTILLNNLGEERQNAAHGKIETLVTRGLQTIFDASLSFHIVPVTKGKSVGIEFVVRTTLSNGETVDTNVLEERGGGLATTIGFLLRLIVMLLQGGQQTDNILVLDETFAQVSAEYLDAVGEFVREIVDRTGVQMILVTHQPEFLAYADKAYRFTSVDGRTQVTAGE